MGRVAAPIRFDATVDALEGSTILRLPETASRRLPSRGQVAVRGTIDGHPFATVVEPDGARGHWMRVEAEVRTVTGLQPGDTASLEIEPATEWPEPTVPQDLGT